MHYSNKDSTYKFIRLRCIRFWWDQPVCFKQQRFYHSLQTWLRLFIIVLLACVIIERKNKNTILKIAKIVPLWEWCQTPSNKWQDVRHTHTPSFVVSPCSPVVYIIPDRGRRTKRHVGSERSCLCGRWLWRCWRQWTRDQQRWRHTGCSQFPAIEEGSMSCSSQWPAAWTSPGNNDIYIYMYVDRDNKTRLRAVAALWGPVRSQVTHIVQEFVRGVYPASSSANLS